jgi:hypothetical protein
MDRCGNAHETEAGLLARTAVNEAEPASTHCSKRLSGKTFKNKLKFPFGGSLDFPRLCVTLKKFGASGHVT